MPVAADKFRDLTMPFDSRMVTHFFGASKPPSGESVELRAKGAVLLHLHRGATQLADGASVTVVVKGGSGAELARWVTDLNPVTPHGFIRRVDLPEGAASIQVSAVDRAEGGPTGQPPYTLTLEAWPLSASSVVELLVRGGLQKRIEPPLAARQPTCKMVGAPSKRPDYIEKFAKVDLSGLPFDVPVQRLLSAGGYLLISPPTGLAAGSRLTVRLLVKYSGDGPYVEVCPPTVLEGGTPQSIEAELPTQDAYSIWRVELSLSKPLAIKEKASLEFTRERVLVTPDPFRAEPGWNNARGLACFDRVTHFQGVPQSTNAFAGRTRLNIALPAAGSVPIGTVERAAAETVVLQAASLWVYSCVACKPDNLAVVSVNGNVYVSETLYMLAGPSRGLVSPPPPEPAAAEQMLTRFLGSARIGTGAPFLPYRRTENPRKDFERLCSISANERYTPTLKRVQNALCTNTVLPGTSANIRVNFKNGETACGGDADIVGCRADHELTQYNVRDYRFTAQPSGISIGNGPVEVDLLQAVLHEMGHWIGVNHMTKGESIMAPSMEQARCIDFETVKAVAEQTLDSNGPDKLVGPQALTLHRKSTLK
ncbi:MAG: matrixin family metalloprotease [Betaproteobacteria bacterium]|nr:matrixin family metalloprotease [Betaproteobacteria bacterium]